MPGADGNYHLIFKADAQLASVYYTYYSLHLTIPEEQGLSPKKGIESIKPVVKREST